MAGGFSFGMTAIKWSDVLQKYAFFIMQDYLTNVWGLSFTHAAGILNIWEGIQRILPLFFLYCIDEFFRGHGHRVLLSLSTVANTVGLAFIAMSTPPVLSNVTGTCKQYEPECIGSPQKSLFYMGMALIAVGTAGREVISVDSEEAEEGQSCYKKMSVKAIAMCLLIIPRIVALVLPNITMWSIRFGVPSICAGVATCLFLNSMRSFNIAKPEQTAGSPITTLFRVLVACTLKRNKPSPKDVKELYRPDPELIDDSQQLERTQTRCLGFLDKAAIETSEEESGKNRWNLISVSEVEEAKIAIRLLPLWVPVITCGIVLSIGNTYIVEQANHLRSPRHFTIPVFLVILELHTAFVKKTNELLASSGNPLTDLTSNPINGLLTLIMMSVGCCIAAATIERRRLNVVTSHDLLDRPDAQIPMNVFWMLIPFYILGQIDAGIDLVMQAFWEDEAPTSSKHYFGAFTQAVVGLGYMLSTFSVYVVGQVSQRGGKTNWFQFTLNRSRLDKYYWVLTVLTSVNLIVFWVAACIYVDKKQKGKKGQDPEIEAPEETRDSVIEAQEDMHGDPVTPV